MPAAPAAGSPSQVAILASVLRTRFAEEPG
jgi:hypothetical protein